MDTFSHSSFKIVDQIENVKNSGHLKPIRFARIDSVNQLGEKNSPQLKLVENSIFFLAIL